MKIVTVMTTDSRGGAEFAAVEMLEALRATGWHNYSLFLRSDGLLVGYLETEDFEQARARMQEHPVNARWQAEMAPLFESLEQGAADASMAPLEEVFHLE